MPITLEANGEPKLLNELRKIHQLNPLDEPRLNIDDYSFSFSQIFTLPQKARHYIIIYAQKNGENFLRPRFCYKSNSDGGWRGSRGINAKHEFIKIGGRALLDAEHYTQESKLHLRILHAIFVIEQKHQILILEKSLVNHIFTLFTLNHSNRLRIADDVDTYLEEIQYTRTTTIPAPSDPWDKDIMTIARTLPPGRGGDKKFQNVPLIAVIEALNTKIQRLRAANPDPYFATDYFDVPDIRTAEPINFYSMNHTFLSANPAAMDIQVVVFQGVFRNIYGEWRDAHWHFAYIRVLHGLAMRGVDAGSLPPIDKKIRMAALTLAEKAAYLQRNVPHAWIDRICDAQDSITSYGICAHPIDSGVLTSKPVEYTVQLNPYDQVRSIPLGGSKMENYSLITPILMQFMPIQEFMARMAPGSPNPIRLAESHTAG